MKAFLILPLIGALACASCDQKVEVKKMEAATPTPPPDPTKVIVGASLVGYDGKALQNSVKRITNLSGNREKNLEKALEDQ